MKPEVFVDPRMPGALQTQIRRDRRRDLAAVACVALGDRSIDPRDRRRIAALMSLGLYTAVYGLALARRTTSHLTAVPDQLVCVGVDSGVLRERVGAACPALAHSVEHAQERALEGPPDRLVLWVALSVTEWGVFDLTMRWPAPAPAAEQGAP